MNSAEENYLNYKQKYIGLKDAIIFTLERIISKNEVRLFKLEGRVKDLNSIKEKMIRKGYQGNLDDVEDICGVRIICYYLTDMDLLENLIKKEFVIESKSDKQKEADDDRFGYQSRHYIVTLKEHWLTNPLFSDYKGLKIEIQLRTMLMHTWAAISHALLYKHESDAPKEIKRRLNRLSALIELADEQFNSIKDLKSEYLANLKNTATGSNIPINADGMLMLMKKYCSNRIIDEFEIPKLLEEIEEFDFTVADVENMIIKSRDAVIRTEELIAKSDGKTQLPMLSSTGFIRMTLDMMSNEYFNSRFNLDEKDAGKDGGDDDDDDDNVFGIWDYLVSKERAKFHNN